MADGTLRFDTKIDSKGFEKGITLLKKNAQKAFDGIKNIAGVATKAATAGLAAMGAAVGAVAKSAITAYADYEQLVGGVDTLFKESSAKVQAYADQAYKTAGLSANQYMETVTSFSASLLQSLGGNTEKAAEYADMAITDMADNANKMGTSMESIQNAYQGFAKQNYTMLDNLKLGYGGTKNEMMRLIEDAEKLNSSFKASRDENGELALSYADIVDAIHIVQTNMGITGTTALEAADTISGSIASTKAAWQNLLVELGKADGDINAVIQSLVQSASNVLKNMIPVFERVLQAIPQAFTTIFVSVKDTFPALANTLLTSVKTLVPTIKTMVSDIAGYISNSLPMIVETGLDMIMALAEGLTEAIASSNFINAVTNTIKAFVDWIVKNLDKIINAGIKIIAALIEGLIGAIPDLVGSIPQLVAAIVNGFGSLFSSFVDLGKKIVGAIWDGLKKAWEGVANWFSNVWDSLFGGGKKSASISVTANGSHAGGLDYVPFDGYVGQLHRGEAVLTANEARAWRNGMNSSYNYGARPVVLGIDYNALADAVSARPIMIAESALEKAVSKVQASRYNAAGRSGGLAYI